MTYAEKLRDPRWQKKRLEILDRDGFACRSCGRKDQELHVHHLRYTPKLSPWDYDNSLLITLCKQDHAAITELKERIGQRLNGGADWVWGNLCDYAENLPEHWPRLACAIQYLIEEPAIVDIAMEVGGMIEERSCSSFQNGVRRALEAPDQMRTFLQSCQQESSEKAS